jgi:hypothetical protein
MALTKPKLSNINTDVVGFLDPITVLHQGATSPNADVGFLFNRANGLVSNVALYWNESSQSIVTAYTSSTGTTNSNISVSSYADLTVGNVLTVNGGIIGIVGNLTLGNLIANTGVHAVSSVVTGDSYVGGNLLVVGNITTLSREIVTGLEVVAGNLIANSGTSSSNTTTGALVVQGGIGVSGDVNIGTSLTVDNGAYGNVTTTQFGSLFAYAYGSNNFSIIQAWSQGTQGLGINAAGTELYSSGSITFRTSATVRNKDYPTGGTRGVQVASNGAIIASTGIASTTTGTGAVIVTGGAGITGDVNIGANLTYGAAPILNSSKTVTGIGVGDVAIDNFDNATICSAKYLISTRNLNNSQSQSTEILLAQDGANVNIVTYAVNYTGTSELMTFSANIYAGTVTVWASGTGSNNTVKLSRTAIPM